MAISARDCDLETSDSADNPPLPPLSQQLSLLGIADMAKKSRGTERDVNVDSLLEAAPLFSAALLQEHFIPSIPPQHALLGLLDPEESITLQAEDTQDSRLFMNTNVPFSTFICGVQGSGKSHTLACLLGNSPKSGDLGA